MDLGLRGKTAIVTGGASGIGLAARLLAREGARVVLADLDAPRFRAAQRRSARA